MPVVSTASPPSPVKIIVSIEGRGFTESEARKLASSIKSSVKWDLGFGGMDDDEDALVVELSAPPASEIPVPESSAVEKIDAEAIAAMSTPEYRAAKAAGQV